jgi:hypothetical protein
MRYAHLSLVLLLMLAAGAMAQSSEGDTNGTRRRIGGGNTLAPNEDVAPRDAEKKEITPGLAAGPETIGEFEARNWGKQTPQQQAASVERLKQFAEKTRAQLDPDLTLDETKYFLFYSDLKPDEAAKWAGLLDRMYARLAELFGVKGGENIFRGKALVLVFRKREDYVAFEKTMHDTDAGDTLGMCHTYGNGDAHIAFYRQSGDAEFAALMVHESVHAFVHRYRKPPSLPAWANEGLAETIAANLVEQRGRRQGLWQDAVTRLRERGAMGEQFFSGKRIESWQYPVAHMLTEFMIRENRKGYIAFVNGIKDGMKWEDALAQRFGATPDELATAFGDSLRIRNLAAANPQEDSRRPAAGRDKDVREYEDQYMRDQRNENSRNHGPQ